MKTLDIFLADLDLGGAESQRYASLLTADERYHANHMRLDRDRRRYVARRGRLRELLGDKLGCDPRDVPIAYNAFGKPQLKDTNIHFNLSHSRGMALYAIASGCEVGCDLEWQDPAHASPATAEQFFSPREADRLRHLPATQWTEGFFNCWTRKEAFVKAQGGGLSLSLDTFDVTLAPGEPAAFLRGGPGWSIEAFRPFKCLHAAVVAEGADDDTQTLLRQALAGLAAL